jgi:hypothetical protein
MPLDAQARSIVTRAEYAMRMMRRGAALLAVQLDGQGALKDRWNDYEGGATSSFIRCPVGQPAWTTAGR